MVDNLLLELVGLTNVLALVVHQVNFLLGGWINGIILITWLLSM